ncbi:amino acid adenylation domain-containing protein [Kitasatospora sp. NPDC058162]|uniref:non-ribosomal peptide synthetase n=1 Tax=Kitasatospora sp. NPDC058162 TaxID=3346362 RepID=UPI0036DB4A8F
MGETGGSVHASTGGTLEWNDTFREFPAEWPLHRLFEDQARATPDRVAVVQHGERLTYRELDDRANRLAHHLIGLGVSPDDVVGVLVDRSPELVVGLLGILKAGAAYLPLDLESPDARLDTILAGADTAVCLTTSRRAAQLPERVVALSLDTEWPVIGASPATGPDTSVHGLGLASVYFTSGSTGTPKGVANTHVGWVNRMVWQQRRHGLRPGDTVLHKTTLTFDDSALELFWPLANGGTVALLDPGLHRDPRAVVDAAVRHRSVLLQVVPSMLTMVLDGLTDQDRDGLSALRNVVSSGEALGPATVARFRESLMDVGLHNTWGATEVSIDSTIHTCGSDDEKDSGAVSLGTPFDNNRVYVLDEDFAQVPVGVVGELYIAGVGLARGYLKDPARTAAAFVPDPFHPGERMYRTGDQGYRRPDGSLKFAGRNDHQVKIRGMRVELGEIEAALTAHPLVSEAVVTVHRSSGDLARLVAYVTPLDPGDAPGPDRLRGHLADRLPDYMVPSFLVVLDSFPLTAHGKVDRAKLPDPGTFAARPGAAQAPPAGPAEEALAEIWCSLLELPSIATSDGFFDLGGHSLLATRLADQVRRRFGIEFPLATVFASPVLRDMAAGIESELAARISEMDDDEVQELFRRIQASGVTKDNERK